MARHPGPSLPAAISGIQERTMSLSGIAIILFLAANLSFAILAGKPSDHIAFALESRRISGFRLACTMLASNLSAFTIFGVSGASYRAGWAYFPVMAFGTAFMAFSFMLFGIPLRRLAANHAWISPADAIRDRFGSPAAGTLFSILLLVYTVPYIATQAGTAGALLSASLGLHPWVGSAIVMSVVLLYILKGGMKSVAHSDVLQLLVMLVLACAAALVVARAASGVQVSTAMEAYQQALQRKGRGPGIPPLELAGYYVLWFFADPMFPHLTQRFFAAKDDRSILKTMALYPFISLLIFFAMTAVGVMGILLEPGLAGPQTDGIFTILMKRYGGMAGPLFSLAALAALMSTLDSQILSSASIFVELFRSRGNSEHMRSHVTAWYRAGALILAVGGWLISLKPPASLLSFLTSTSFLGYASLAPVMLAAIYAPHAGRVSALTAMAAGSGMVAAIRLGVVQPSFPAVFLVLAVSGSIMILGSVLVRSRSFSGEHVPMYRPSLRFWLVSGGFFLAGIDVWNYGRPVRTMAGIPTWVWYHVVVILAMGVFLLAQSRETGSAPDCTSG